MRKKEWHEMSIARAETLARAVGDAAVQIRGRREGDRVQHEVEPPPLRANRFEQCFHVAGCARRRAASRSSRRALAPSGSTYGRAFPFKPRHCELGAAAAEHARTAVGDALRVGDADHQALAAGEQRFGADVHGGHVRRGDREVVSERSRNGRRCGLARPERGRRRRHELSTTIGCVRIRRFTNRLIREGRIESAVSLTEGRPFAHDFACGATYRSFQPHEPPRAGTS
jgi:hypothetical protein